MARNTRRIYWEDVEVGMLVIIDEDLPPRKVGDIGVSLSKRDGVYVAFSGGGGHNYPKRELVTVVTESDSLEPVKLRMESFLATDRSLATLEAVRSFMANNTMRDDEAIAFFAPRIRAEWKNLKELMKMAGLDD